MTRQKLKFAALPHPGDQAACHTCGKPFTRQRSWQRFCSPPCRVEFFKQEQRIAVKAFRASLKESA